MRDDCETGRSYRARIEAVLADGLPDDFGGDVQALLFDAALDLPWDRLGNERAIRTLERDPEWNELAEEFRGVWGTDPLPCRADRESALEATRPGAWKWINAQLELEGLA
jgi:hypothetical protein